MSKKISGCAGKGFAVWLTGLPSSGKSTLAIRLEKELRTRGHRVEVLDGDEARRRLAPKMGFSKEDRDANVKGISFVAKLLVRNDVAVIVAAISPYRSVRDEARNEIGRFVEVYVDCLLEECMKRDVKGMYKKALTGEIQNFTGVSDPYEPPLSPELVVHTNQESVEQSLGTIVAGLETMGYLGATRPLSKASGATR